MTRVLFVALGESEVPAAEGIAGWLADNRVADAKVVTWLPRLSSESTTSLEMSVRGRDFDARELAERMALYGVAHPSMSADYDRDWHFASVRAKTRHVARIFFALSEVFEDYQPDLVVSSVGGETTRMVGEVVARERGVPTAYFNAIPMPGRYAFLKSLSAPFIPYEGDNTSFKPLVTTTTPAATGQLGQAPQKASTLEGVARIWSQFGRGEKTYPNTWIPRKASALVQARALRTISPKEQGFDPTHEVKIVYPLHDERDFQVAVRERHAVPQAALLRYLSSELPPGFHLYLKPHPEHLGAHHSSRWRQVADRPNVHFLPARMSPRDAIANADVVLTLASSMGFEAVQVSKPVVCYGRPFYGARGVTIDVADPRKIVGAIRAAVSSIPDGTAVEHLKREMLAWSWEGKFTPLDLDPENLEKLARGVADVVGQI